MEPSVSLFAHEILLTCGTELDDITLTLPVARNSMIIASTCDGNWFWQKSDHALEPNISLSMSNLHKTALTHHSKSNTYKGGTHQTTIPGGKLYSPEFTHNLALIFEDVTLLTWGRVTRVTRAFDASPPRYCQTMTLTFSTTNYWFLAKLFRNSWEANKIQKRSGKKTSYSLIW